MRFGLGWRAELGAGIVAHLDEIDVVEVIADDFVDATAEQRRAFRFLRSHVRVVLHATSLGLASAERVSRARLDAIARVVGWLEPDFWSEHLAFVRAAGTEVGHLAAPPRNDGILDGLARNVEEARRATGSLPLLENVASLVDPPFSTYDEQSWLHGVLAATPCDLLLDLHNLHANAVNFAFDAAEVVRSLPNDRIGAVHLAGGRRIEGERILDDHLHRVPDEVFALLAQVHAPEATVILERDGEYPPIEELLGEIARARSVVRVDAFRRNVTVRPRHTNAPGAPATLQTEFLAMLYTDAAGRTRFLDDPEAAARAAGLSEAEVRDALLVDRDALLLAARGFARKRATKGM
jgi:uncharacterized protein (UPF0276 family)